MIHRVVKIYLTNKFLKKAMINYYVWRSQLDKKQYLDSAIGEALYKKYANDDKRNRYSGKR